MKIKQWNDVYRLAAELIALYRTDANQVQKTAQYLVNHHDLSYAEISRWLNAQINHADEFPRSQQTVRHIKVVREVVGYIGARHTKDASEMAEMLGWIARLMVYFRDNPDVENYFDGNKKLLRLD